MNRLLTLIALPVVLQFQGCDRYVYHLVNVSPSQAKNLKDFQMTLMMINSGIYDEESTAGGTIYHSTLFRLSDQTAAVTAPDVESPSVVEGTVTLYSSLAALQIDDDGLGGFSTGSKLMDQQFFTDFVGVDDEGEMREYLRNMRTTVANVGVDTSGVLSWGRWTHPNQYDHGTLAAGCCGPNTSFHYVYGTVTPNAEIPATGTATFNLAGATAPTMMDGSLSPGSLNAGSTVGVVWGGASSSTQIGVDLSGAIGGHAFQVQTPGGSTNPALSGVTYDSASRSFSGTTPDDGAFAGFFAGSNASHVGLTYTTPVISGAVSIGTVQGAAAFKR